MRLGLLVFVESVTACVDFNCVVDPLADVVYSGIDVARSNVASGCVVDSGNGVVMSKCVVSSVTNAEWSIASRCVVESVSTDAEIKIRV